jgi:hypothetical protein
MNDSDITQAGCCRVTPNHLICNRLGHFIEEHHALLDGGDGGYVLIAWPVVTRCLLLLNTMQ